jgi:hypothetical protein
MSWRPFITRRRLLVIISISLVFAALYSPFSFSARLRHKVKIVLVAAEKTMSEWRGHKSQLISIKGETGLAGAQVQVLDSKSGWASLCDLEGRFTIPDIVWYSNASYELIVSTDDSKGKQIKIDTPSTLPPDGVIEVGRLLLDDATEVDQERLPGMNLVSFQKYDFQNRDYYRKLYEDLTTGKNSHEENVDAVNNFIAKQLNYNETQWDSGPRRIIDHGSQYCGHLSVAMATVLAIGYSTRIVNLRDGADPPNTHVVVEVFYKGGWHLYDPTYGVTFKDKAGRVVSYKELRLDPGLISEETFSAFRQQYPKASFNRMRDMYNSGYHHYYSLTFECSQFCHAWWAYPNDLNYVPSGERIWLAAAGICPGTRVTYHIRKADSNDDEMTFSSQETGNSVCVLNQEQSPPINLAQGTYKVFVDLEDGNIRTSNYGTPSLITNWKLSVNLEIK